MACFGCVLVAFLVVLCSFLVACVRGGGGGGGELKIKQTGVLPTASTTKNFFSLRILIILEKVLDRYIANVIIYQ